MPGFAWDATNDRTLLLQVLALHPAAISYAEREIIAQKWNNGKKKDAYRMRFGQMKAEGEELMGKNKEGKKITSDGADNKRNKSLFLMREVLILEGRKLQVENAEKKGRASKKVKIVKKEVEIDEIHIKEDIKLEDGSEFAGNGLEFYSD